MPDFAPLYAEGRRFTQALERRQSQGDLHGLYLQMVPLAAQVRGTVQAVVRDHPADPRSAQLASALERAQADFRAVGLDVRVASPASLHGGLQTALQELMAVVDLAVEVAGGDGPEGDHGDCSRRGTSSGD